MKNYLRKRGIEVTSFDYFILFNSVLFLLMCIFVYYDRFIAYRGEGNIVEFFIYASVIFAIIAVAWSKFRYLHVNLPILIMIEVGILMHFAGAFVQVDGHRLYDSRFFEIRYDKYVHFVNAMIATFVTIYIFAKRKFPDTHFMLLVAVLTVLGLGGINEIVEFVVTLTVEHNGVGAYNNNMLDLVANFFGSLTAVVLYEYFLKRYFRLKSL